MVCIQVMGNDCAVAFAGSQGNFELNVTRPLVINNVLHSSTLLADACKKFQHYCIEGITVNEPKIKEFLQESLMLVTALNPLIGYDKAAAIAHKALDENTTLRQAAIASGFISPEKFDEVVVPEKMVGNPQKDLDSIKT